MPRRTGGSNLAREPTGRGLENLAAQLGVPFNSAIRTVREGSNTARHLGASLVRLLELDSMAKLSEAVRLQDDWDRKPDPGLVMIRSSSMSYYLSHQPERMDAESYRGTLLRQPGFDATNAQKSLPVRALRVDTKQSSDGRYVVARLLIEHVANPITDDVERLTTQATPQLLAELLAIERLAERSGIEYLDKKTAQAQKKLKEGVSPQFAITLGRISTEILGDRPPVVTTNTSLVPEFVTLQGLSIYPPLEGEPPGITLN